MIMKEKERKYRAKEGDTQTDFVEYLEFLMHCYKQLEKLDAGGGTLGNIFMEKESLRS